MTNNEDAYAAELAKGRAATTKKEMGKRVRKRMKKAKKTGALGTILKNPIFKLLIPLGVEIIPGTGLLPSWLLYVLYTYHEEKKAGLSPNIAEYIIVGGAAATSDTIDVLNLTGFGMIIGKGIDIPTVGFLYIWRINKHGLMSAMSKK